MSASKRITSTWDVHEYIPALGYYMPRMVLQNVYGSIGEQVDYPIVLEVIPADSNNRYPELNTPAYAILDDGKAIATALGTHELIEWSEQTNEYGTLLYVEVRNAWTGDPLGKLYCTSHESLDPLVAREERE